MSQADNPFAPGPSEVGERAGHDRVDVLEPVPMDVGEILTRCWEVFSNNVGVVLAAMCAIIAPGLVFGASGFAIDVMAETMTGDTQLLMQMLSVGNSLLQQLVTLFFTLGATRVFIHVTRGQDAEVGMIVGEAGSYLPALGAQILVGLAAMVSLAPGLIAFGAASAGAMSMENGAMMLLVNVVLMAIPATVVMTGLTFIDYVIVDRGVGPIEAMKESWRLTDGYKMTVFFVLMVAVVLLLVATCLTLGIGYLFFAPVVVLMEGVMYHSLTHYQGLIDDPWKA